jgi:hypothetical protein
MRGKSAGPALCGHRDALCFHGFPVLSASHPDSVSSMSTLPTGSQGVVSSQDLHPVAFLRARPFLGKIVADLAATMGPRQTYVEAAMRQAAESMTKAYGTIRRQLSPEYQTHEAAVGIISGTFEVITAQAQFVAAGRQIFALPRALVTALDHTDLGDVRFSDVVLPFPAFYVHVGDALPLALPGIPNRVVGAYVFHQDAAPGRLPYLAVTLVSRRIEERLEDPLDWAQRREPHQQLRFDLDLPPGADTLEAYMERFLREESARMHARLRDDGGAGGVPSDSAARAYLQQLQSGWATYDRLVRLVLNALVYMASLRNAPRGDESTDAPQWPSDTPGALLQTLTSAPEGPAGRKKRRAAMGRLVEAGYLPLRMLPPLEPSDDAAAIGREGHSLAPHFRRAHWRRQGVGPGRTEVRLTRVRATLVRPDRGVPAQGRVRTVSRTGSAPQTEQENG